jgi:hypothetical protein
MPSLFTRSFLSDIDWWCDEHIISLLLMPLLLRKLKIKKITLRNWTLKCSYLDKLVIWINVATGKRIKWNGWEVISYRLYCDWVPIQQQSAHWNSLLKKQTPFVQNYNKKLNNYRQVVLRCGLRVRPRALGEFRQFSSNSSVWFQGYKCGIILTYITERHAVVVKMNLYKRHGQTFHRHQSLQLLSKFNF